jgi:phosphatidylserine decarboxylase
MDVLHTNNNCRGLSDVSRRPFKSGPHFVHLLTSASQLEIIVVRSIFQALQPALPRRQFKSMQKHPHSLTKCSAKSLSDSVGACSISQALQPESRHAYAAVCSGTVEQSRYALGEIFPVGLTRRSNRSLRSLGLAKASPLA